MVSAFASSGTSLGLLSTALVLGLRHGIDWDHIAAIADITGTVTADSTEPTLAPVRQSTGRRAMYLATMYAAGHGAVVAALGAIALVAGQILPDWIDPIMERLVGVTLLALGLWILYSALNAVRTGGSLTLRSRWMLVGSGTRRLWQAVSRWGHGHAHDGEAHLHRIDGYGPRSAFGVGMIHGIGAETGSQVLLIASIGGADAQGLGGAMLVSFVAGLLVSNAVIAALTSAGFLATSRARVVLFGTSVVVAAFSVAIGVTFVLGATDVLPDLDATLRIVLGD